MRRQLLLAPVCLCALELAGGHTAVSSATPSVQLDQVEFTKDHCVRYDQQPRDDGITLSLTSTCETTRQCSVKWHLRCGGDKHIRKGGARFALSPTSTQTVDASASVCGEASWKISRVRWRCKATVLAFVKGP